MPVDTIGTTQQVAAQLNNEGVLVLCGGSAWSAMHFFTASAKLMHAHVATRSPVTIQNSARAPILRQAFHTMQVITTNDGILEASCKDQDVPFNEAIVIPLDAADTEFEVYAAAVIFNMALCSHMVGLTSNYQHSQDHLRKAEHLYELVLGMLLHEDMLIPFSGSYLALIIKLACINNLLSIIRHPESLGASCSELRFRQDYLRSVITTLTIQRTTLRGKQNALFETPEVQGLVMVALMRLDPWSKQGQAKAAVAA